MEVANRYTEKRQDELKPGELALVDLSGDSWIGFYVDPPRVFVLLGKPGGPLTGPEWINWGVDQSVCVSFGVDWCLEIGAPDQIDLPRRTNSELAGPIAFLGDTPLMRVMKSGGSPPMGLSWLRLDNFQFTNEHVPSARYRGWKIWRSKADIARDGAVPLLVWAP